MESSLLIAQIARVFPVEPIPTKDDILRECVYPGEEEGEEIALFFGGRAWTCITPNDVFRFRHALSFFSLKALAYHTAAWMTCSLLDEVAVDTAIENLVGTLGRADENLWTQEQQHIICEWLIHFKDVPLKERFEAAVKKLGCTQSK